MSERLPRFVAAAVLLAALAFALSLALELMFGGSVNLLRAAVWSVAGGAGLSYIAVYGRG
ncbi:MAG: hypothetical protein HY677_04825 [Chloroflexi bacterium]|nr:hypothetical protein [Chloroflexota bacterium]